MMELRTFVMKLTELAISEHSVDLHIHIPLKVLVQGCT